jgi:hypothetical protein
MLTKFLISMTALACLAPAAFAQKTMDPRECEQWMMRMDADGTGTLTGNEAAAFVEKMAAANTPPATTGTITKDEFMATCQKGGFEGVSQ